MSPVTSGNFANYNQKADWNSQDGNVSTVGTNGGASAYGAFDMSGNLGEWYDLTGAAGTTRGTRGGHWSSNGALGLSSPQRTSRAPSEDNDALGFRLASVAVPEPSTYALATIASVLMALSIRRRNRSKVCLIDL